MFFLIILELIKLKKIYIKFIFICIGIFLIMKITYRTSGIDYENYVDMFNSVKLSGLDYLKSRIEPLFVLLLYFSKNKEVAFGIIGCITIFFKLNSIYKYSIFPFVSLIFYYYSFYYIDDLGRIRIGIATAILIYSIRFLKEKKFFIFLIIAILFHKSSILYLIPHYFVSKKINKEKLIKILITSLFLSLFDWSYFFILLKNIDFFSSTVVLYIDSIQRIGFTPYILSKLFFMLLFIINFNKLKYYKYFNELFIIYFIGNIFYFTFNSIKILATRGSEVFICIEFLILPYLLKTSKNVQIKFIIFIILVLYYLYTGKDFIFISHI